MSSATSTIQVTGLAKEKLHALRAQARAAGMAAEVYAKQLIEEAVTLEQQAQTKTFDELYAPAQERFRKSAMKEEDLDKLVNAARTRHHRRTSRKNT
jgi:ribosomal protein L10